MSSLSSIFSGGLILLVIICQCQAFLSSHQCKSSCSVHSSRHCFFFHHPTPTSASVLTMTATPLANGENDDIVDSKKVTTDINSSPTGVYKPLYEEPDGYFDDDDTDSLEEEMSQDLYNQLKGFDERLSVDSFLQWDEIQEILSHGTMDKETISFILSEAGVTNDVITYDQFREVVDLVNQVNETLESTIDDRDYAVDGDFEDETSTFFSDSDVVRPEGPPSWPKL